MEVVTVSVLVSVAVPTLLAGVWLVRLEGRVKTHERVCDERAKRLDERHDDIGKQLADMDRKLDRLVDGRRWDGTERRR